MPQPQLPTELLRAIIAEVASSKGGKRANLGACCLVSKSMLPFAREALYRVVGVSIFGTQTDEGVLVRPLSKRLLTTVVNNQHIGAVVKRLEIGQASDAITQAMRSPLEALVGACERLEQFVWHSAYGYEVEGAGWLETLLKTRGGTLQTLYMSGHYPWSAISFVDMLHRLPRLRYLTLNHVPQLASTPTPRPSARLITISIRHPVQHALLDLLLGASQESLTELNLAGFIADDTYDFTAYTSLRNISLSKCPEATTPADLARLFQAFGTVPSLETLDLMCYTITAKLEAIDVFCLLPPSLRRIYDFGGITLSTRYLLAFLGDRSCLPALELLRISLRCGGRVTRPNEEILAIEAAAKGRGVDLRWWT